MPILDEAIHGSPPRAWGQSLQQPSDVLAQRFTPTGVGTISCSPRTRRRTAVHPHGRGDNRLHFNPEPLSAGSPPRAWGQLDADLVNVLLDRFTPTGVGTIAAALERGSAETVHPHGRGDNLNCVDEPSSSAGSPPRAWGQFPMKLPVASKNRFTPTGVGTISSTPDQQNRTTVHPHGRGDNLSIVNAGEERNGSPPRAWGQLTSQ